MEGLMAAHENGFVHRDLKPTNIMVQWFPSGRYQLKILDFGMAKFSPLPSPQSMDQSDAIYGSIYFMAPEQFELGLLDLRTDIYAMGCIYYYCLTGKVPFYGDSAAAVMNSHLQGEPVSLERYRPDLPPSMVNWTMRLLSRKAIQRPANAIEALKEFQKARENPDYLPTTPLGLPKALAG